jgi:hypothetical protein
LQGRLYVSKLYLSEAKKVSKVDTAGVNPRATEKDFHLTRRIALRHLTTAEID